MDKILDMHHKNINQIGFCSHHVSMNKYLNNRNSLISKNRKMERTIFNDHHQFATISDDLGLIDFMDEANIDHFIDLIRGDNIIDQADEAVNINYLGDHFDHHQHNVTVVGSVCNNNVDSYLFPPVELFDFNFLTGHVKNNNGNNNFPHDHLLGNLQVINDEEAEEEEEIMDGEEYSSATTMTTTRKTKNGNSSKGDRSRTLVSERRRRGRMKEKLCALRALVPNITKMDKASIVGDAVLYVQELQMQAKKLKSEIDALESSSTTTLIDHHHFANQINNLTTFYPLTKKIFKMDVFEVEERGFYVRIVSNKGKGVAVYLYRGLESLTSFDVRTSNLAAASDETYVFTFTLHMMEGMDLDSENLKLWIASIFLDQGFQFQTS